MNQFLLLQRLLIESGFIINVTTSGRRTRELPPSSSGDLQGSGASPSPETERRRGGTEDGRRRGKGEWRSRGKEE